MKRASLLFASLAFLVFQMPAHAHHPGAGLDQLMHNKEKFFQVVDVPSAPSFELADTDGKTVHLSDFSDKIVVLNFIFANCDDVCPLHSELIARIQAMINATPMKDRVQFISITTDPANDTLDVMKTYGPTHGLDLYNWTFLTTRLGQPEDTTRKLAKEYGFVSAKLKVVSKCTASSRISLIAAAALRRGFTVAALTRLMPFCTSTA